ncbi:hypothetical protein [Deinococcus marmoris]|uniref:Uncharacterized protein n=1 Tax=Deinococcus marmoris TaxID=249408 RepID=A0A1U7NUW0_9DEIO|nr:hypothetical protein [Deinococcus marmoris]OLV16708.1 hypothetical protein BOO71_0010993 [Deinococcus marmoris]
MSPGPRRGKTSRVKLHAYDIEILEGHRQVEEDRTAEETLA